MALDKPHYSKILLIHIDYIKLYYKYQKKRENVYREKY